MSLALIVYKFFDKKSALLAWSETLATRDKSVSRSSIKNKNISQIELAEGLHNWTYYSKIKKRKVHSIFVDNIWVANLAYMQLVSKFN